jgi:hypothetical protein
MEGKSNRILEKGKVWKDRLKPEENEVWKMCSHVTCPYFCPAAKFQKMLASPGCS